MVSLVGNEHTKKKIGHPRSHGLEPSHTLQFQPTSSLPATTVGPACLCALQEAPDSVRKAATLQRIGQASSDVASGVFGG